MSNFIVMLQYNNKKQFWLLLSLIFIFLFDLIIYNAILSASQAVLHILSDISL